MNDLILSDAEWRAHVRTLRACNPLVHCMTNDVVQEITANVLLAAGASPAMIVAPEEAAEFAAMASALLINVGTLRAGQFEAMRLAVGAALEHGRPWVLDPVAAGLLSWRDARLRDLLELGPTVIRGNASEVLALAGFGSGGRGVDSTEGSECAREAAQALARQCGAVVCVTGAVDIITDGVREWSVSGGCPLMTRVVGTGCSLSALVAAFVGAAAPGPRAEAVAAACCMAKAAAAEAAGYARGTGGLKSAYLDALSRCEDAGAPVA